MSTQMPLADDLLDGVPDYAAFTGFSERRCYYLLDTGRLPGGKMGTRWIGSKRAVASYLTNITSGAALAGTQAA